MKLHGELGTRVGGESHPTGVRGLKSSGSRRRAAWTLVAPHWGAWIEIRGNQTAGRRITVAPHWGAWIEIGSDAQERRLYRSHPTGVRGLKYREPVRPVRGHTVAPHWGAWIEMWCAIRWKSCISSHPTGVRGLKYLRENIKRLRFQSHPTGVRGLKYYIRISCAIYRYVAPHWGAWIEIS